MRTVILILCLAATFQCYATTLFQKFKAIRGNFNRDQAKQQCEKAGGVLALPKTNADNAIIKNSIGYNSGYWIQPTFNVATKTWVDIKDAPVTNFFWVPGEPNNVSGDEFCVEIYLLGGQPRWNDLPCKNVVRGGAICEFSSGQTIPGLHGISESMDAYKHRKTMKLGPNMAPGIPGHIIRVNTLHVDYPGKSTGLNSYGVSNNQNSIQQFSSTKYDSISSDNAGNHLNNAGDSTYYYSFHTKKLNIAFALIVQIYIVHHFFNARLF